MFCVKSEHINLHFEKDSVEQPLNESQMKSDGEANSRSADKLSSVTPKVDVYDTMGVDDMNHFISQFKVLKNPLFVFVTLSLCSVYFVVTGI